MSRTTADGTSARSAVGPAWPAVLGLRRLTGASLVAVASLLAVVALSVGLSGPGWLAGLSVGVALTAATVRGLRGTGCRGAGQADLVTLARGILACGLAALAVDVLLGRHVAVAVVALAVPALVSDALDGWVARRSATVTAFGGRFDGEVDALLILVLSVHVAHSLGWWVLSAGLARYAFGVGVWGLPWMGRQLPYRYWRKVVTASVSIGLTVGATGLLSPSWTLAVIAGALLLLAESFGRDVLWLWRRRDEVSGAVPS